MDAPSVSLRETAASDLETVADLLDVAGLPASDLRDGPGQFYLATDGEAQVGVGGLEVYGTAGLLRSVVVPPGSRGQGYGTAVCDALEATARDAGVETLYLLTTTAGAFFADRGYERVDRSAAPEPIQATTQFEALCPAGATCMRKQL